MAVRPYAARELKFQRLAAELRRGVLDGARPQGSKLPTEQELVAETGLSVTTVRRGYEVLVEQRLVERRQGAGTFAAPRPGAIRHVSAVVGVLVPTTSSYHPRVLQGIEEALAVAGARMVLVCSHDDQVVEREAIDRLVGRPRREQPVRPALLHRPRGRRRTGGEHGDRKVVRPARIRAPGSRYARRALGPRRISAGGLFHD
ncbi:GntR family transcriptional regulator [Streptomyces sp. NPDC058239]|uniref:GntR family transcriptional regulator n=1 Tax=Streptomyces sp. NPDC058239 TaxID=3346395 RepID=UPI0036EABBCA